MSILEVETKIAVKFLSQKIAEQFFASISPELSGGSKGRSKVRCAPPTDGLLEFVIMSKDLTAARAAYNSIIQYLRVIDEAFALPQKETKSLFLKGG